MRKGQKKSDGLVPWCEIAAELGVSPQRVQMIAAAAIAKMRRGLMRRGVDEATVAALLRALERRSFIWDQIELER